MAPLTDSVALPDICFGRTNLPAPLAMSSTQGTEVLDYFSKYLYFCSTYLPTYIVLSTCPYWLD